MPHAKIFNRADGKFELETRRNAKLRNELAFNLPADTRVFDSRLGSEGRWILSEAVRPRVLAVLHTLGFEVESIEAQPQISKPPTETPPDEQLDDLMPQLPDLPAL